MEMPRYDFTRNDPFDKNAPIAMVVERCMPSRDYMRSIREYPVAPGALAVWFLGQNGFILKASGAPLIGIDLYLTDSCGDIYRDLPFRCHRQLPVFIEPEDLDVDVFLTTHSHDDHADPETLRRVPKDETLFAGPWQSVERYRKFGVRGGQIRLLHPRQELALDGVTVTGTFALPTDDTDLNHMGLLLRFGRPADSGTTFYNTGDTAYCDLLGSLLPHGVDIAAICINGGFHNLSHMDAARIVKAIGPKVAIPCHYDMMVNNIGDPGMFAAALGVTGADARFQMLQYYEPWVYAPGANNSWRG